MRTLRALPILFALCLLALSAPLAPAAAAPPAEQPPLVLFASVPAGTLDRGDRFSVVLSVYSMSAAPVELTLQSVDPSGLTQIEAPRWGASSTWYDHPMTIVLTYQIGPNAPTGGAIVAFRYTMTDSAGNVASVERPIQIGVHQWPPAQLPRKLFLPIVEK